MVLADLDGVLTALLTPTTDAGDVDRGALAALIDFQAVAGVHGLFVLGTAGQGPMLDVAERKALAEDLVDASRGRLRVVVHVGALPMSVATDLAAHALRIRADAISSVPPGYYQPDYPAVCCYYRGLRDAVGDGIPFLAYNNPSATGYDLRPRQAAELHEQGVIDGVKQASANIADLAALLAVALAGGQSIEQACKAGCDAGSRIVRGPGFVDALHTWTELRGGYAGGSSVL